MLGGVVDAMSIDMSQKLDGHFNSLQAHFRPVEARVQALKDEQAYLHAMSRQAESSRTGTYFDARQSTRLAHQDRIRRVPKIVSWSELQKTPNTKSIIRDT